MADRPEIRESIDISDFTAGIHAGYNSIAGANGEPAPDGAAQEGGTVGCIGLPNGGLGPLPREERVYTGIFNDHVRRPFYFSDESPFIAILDIMLLPGVHPPDFLSDAPDDTGSRQPHPVHADYSGVSDLFLFILERYYDPTGSGTNFQRQWRACYHSLFLNPSIDLVNPAFGAFNPHPLIDWTGTYPTAQQENAMDYGFGCIDLGRDNSGDATRPGQPQFRFGFGGRLNLPAEDSGGYNGRAIYAYPEQGINNTASPIHDSGGIGPLLCSPCIVLSHQGRLVWANVTNPNNIPIGGFYYEGANWIVGSNSAAGIITSEELYWTKVNSLVGDNFNGTVFVEENPVGIGTWASMNANELFLVKHNGGAVVVQGSLNNPTVVRLPGVQSTYGTVSHPVVTPLGCIYGTRSGVWVWNGSDTATCISPNLSGYFWKPDSSEHFHPAQLVGRFGYHYPYVFVPNNWIFDVRTKGWFRLSTTSNQSLAFYNTSFQGQVYGSPAMLVVPVQGDDFEAEYLFSFNMELGCNTWTWKSQPLQKTKNRRLDFREMEITAQGVGTITVDVSGLLGDSQTLTFDVDSATRPVSMFQQFAVSSHDTIVTITSTATDPDDQAPTLYRISLGYRTAQSLTATGSVPGS